MSLLDRNEAVVMEVLPRSLGCFAWYHIEPVRFGYSQQYVESSW